MSILKCRPDADDAKKRLGDWWSGKDIGRPIIMLSVPREEPLEALLEAIPPKERHCPKFTTKSLTFRINNAINNIMKTDCFGELLPFADSTIGTTSLAMYLGCNVEENETTVWTEPFLKSESDDFEYNENNFYWKFQLELIKELMKKGEGKFLVSFPDLVEGLDILGAMQGTSELLYDFMDNPDLIQKRLEKITSLYFKYYNVIYNNIKDELGGSIFWAWAPGKMAKLQCDISAMLSPDMFSEFAVPYLEEMSGMLTHCMYHLDGPAATRHLDSLLTIKGIDMIQWTPGAGVEAVDDPRWWPMFHEIVDSGKKVHIHNCRSLESLIALKKEFGHKLNQFMLKMSARTSKAAERIIKSAYL